MYHPLAHDLMKAVNGSFMNDDGRFGFLSLEKAAEVVADLVVTIGGATDALEKGVEISEELAKTVTTANGIFGVDLAAPTRNLYPTLTPLANTLNRNTRTNPGNAFQYKVITAVAGSGFNHFGFVPEGGRAGRMSYAADPKAISYATLGEEDAITDEATAASQGFENILATAALRVLLKAKAKEEAAILGGNNNQALGVCPTPTASASGTGASLAAATYSVICVALTQMGYQNSSLAGGIATSMTVTAADGKTFTINGGSSMKSAAASQAVTSGQTLFASVTPVAGAVAYAWFVGVSGSEKLEAITTINSVSFATALNGTRQAATAVTADCSADTKAYNGFIATTFANGTAGNAQVKTLATGTPGTGTQLTSNGYGGVTEIDEFLKNAWDLYRIGYSVIYVSSQELKSVTKLALTGTSTSLLNYQVSADNSGKAGFELTAGGVVAYYTNPYSIDGSSKIPIKIHPNLAPGTMMFVGEQLPPWYVSNETPAVAEIIVRRDWSVEDWARVTRQKEMGIYCQTALAIYAPFCTGLITNIAPTT